MAKLRAIFVIGILVSGAAQAQAFDPQDAISVLTRLEPADTFTRCSEFCYSINGLFRTTPGNFGSIGRFDTNADKVLGYMFRECRSNQTGCKWLEINVSYDSGKQFTPEKVARWNGGKPACIAYNDEDWFASGLALRISLTPATTIEQIEGARAQLRACKVKFDVF